MSSKSLFIFICIILGCATVHASPWGNDGREGFGPGLVRKDERISLVSTEFGEITAVHVGEGAWGARYHLQFITLEPNALFLPVLLHADMVFYVDSGAGILSWADDDGTRNVKLRRGDVFRLRPGSIFFVQSNLETERRKLRIYASFTNAHDGLHESSMGPYSSIRDIVLGFDKEVLQAAFQVPKEMIAELTSGPRQPAIVHATTTEKKEKSLWEVDSQFLEVILGRSGSMFDVNKKKKKSKAFNIFDQKPDFKNRYGQSLIVNKKNLHALKKPNLSILMVNLTGGSMMGPHWNPMASEVSIVLQGEGMISIVGPSTKNASDNNQSTRFHVGEGDVFVVPRFHPMAQLAFSNNSFVFMGFSSSTKKNHPQFLAGKASVLRTLEKEIVAASFGVANISAFDRFLDQQGESVILECASCAEEELRIVKEEEKRQREEEEKRRREEEERKREEEEKKRKEEEEAKRREEEAEIKKREEEARKKREEQERRKQEEEEAKRREEEAEEKKREEEERRRREEEEAKRREEEARKRREEEARREEEEAKRQEEERQRREKEEAMRRKEEEERARKEKEKKEEARREEEEAKRQEEEKRQQEEEEARERKEEERQKGEEEEEEARRKKEEQARKQEEEEREQKAREEEQEAEEKEREKEKEEARIREEEARKRREEAARKEEEAARKQEEEAVKREKEEEARRKEEEEEKARRHEEETQEEEEGGGGEWRRATKL